MLPLEEIVKLKNNLLQTASIWRYNRDDRKREGEYLYRQAAFLEKLIGNHYCDVRKYNFALVNFISELSILYVTLDDAEAADTALGEALKRIKDETVREKLKTEYDKDKIVKEIIEEIKREEKEKTLTP